MLATISIRNTNINYIVTLTEHDGGIEPLRVSTHLGLSDPSWQGDPHGACELLLVSSLVRTQFRAETRMRAQICATARAEFLGHPGGVLTNPAKIMVHPL